MAEQPPRRLRFLTFNDPHPLRIDRDLAQEIGMNESIVLLQIEYLIGISAHERDGKLWTYQSLTDLKYVYFPWWSIATLSRIIRHLEELELIHIGNYNKLGYDRTQWFALNEIGMNRLSSVQLHTNAILQNEKRILQDENAILQNEKSILQNDRIDPIILQNGIDQNETTIPESTHESTQKRERARKRVGPPAQTSLDSLHEGVAIYKRLTGKRTITPTNAAQIAGAVTDFVLWERVVSGWCGKGHRSENVNGMLDWYEHPEKMARALRGPQATEATGRLAPELYKPPEGPRGTPEETAREAAKRNPFGGKK